MDINQFQKAEKNQQYFAGMRPVFNRKALFTDMSEDYVSPMEPSAYGEVTVRFRAAKNNIDKVFFVHKCSFHSSIWWMKKCVSR